MSNNYYNKNLQPFANNLRKAMTKAETCLWKYALKSRNIKGYGQYELESAGYYVMRFSDDEVLKDMVNAIKRIEAVAEELEKANATNPPPTPASGGHSNA